MLKTLTKGVGLFALLGSTACSYLVRDAETYRNDTQALLETRSGAIKTCYDEVLKSDPTAQGRLTVRFMIQMDTGQVMDLQLDPAGTTAPDALSQCVLTALGGLTLDPPDNGNDGLATFSYEFVINPPAAPAAAAPAG